MKRESGLFLLLSIVSVLLAGCWVQGGLLTESTEASLVIVWEREGGIVGFCDQVVIYDDGSSLVSTCRQREISVSLTAEEEATLDAWREAYRSAEVSEGDLEVTDGLRETLQFYGAGDVAPSAAQLLVMEQFALDLLIRGTSDN